MGSTLVSPPVVKARAIYCPNCGGPVSLHGFAHTLTVVCQQCLSILDASTPEFKILQTLQAAQRVQPKIPLGTRGKVEGIPYEVIGFQVRSVASDEYSFSWEEYLLFNPYQGFRYLSEYNGHWNFIRILSALPQPTMMAKRTGVKYNGRKYARFSTARAQTSYVIGEFPWRVRAGETALVDDYISPPYMLASETTGSEVTWSLGEYWTGVQVWQAFQLPGKPPAAAGIFENQLSPYTGKAGSAWRTWLWLMVALAVLLFATTVAAGRHQVLNQNYSFTPGAVVEPAFVTPVFELTGRSSNVEVNISTDLSNNWIYLNLALINEESGNAFDFGREVSYYTDGGDTDGSRRDHVLIPSVASGHYYLRIEPEGNTQNLVRVNYDITVRRDVPNYSLFWIAALLLTVPPLVTSFRAGGFETKRWRESDYNAGALRSTGDE